MADGFQLQQTARPLLGLTEGNQGEDEICMTTYYDLTGRVPPEAVVPCPPAFQQARQCSHNQAPCTTNGDCASGTCRDGVCCESACDGVCLRCDAAGRCRPVVADRDPDAECPGDGTAT